MSNKDFTDVQIWGTNLEGTNAIINPYKVSAKILWGTNLKGCTLKCTNKLDNIHIDSDTNLEDVIFTGEVYPTKYDDVKNYIKSLFK